MAKLIISRGVSGSGKSTWAEAQAGNPAIVSRDRIRMSLFGSESFIDEDLVTKVEHAAVEAALLGGRDVISDNTNIRMKYVNALAKIAHRVGAPVEVKVFDVPLEVALERNRKRAIMGGRNVPDDVIRKQYNAFKASKNHTPTEVPTVAPYYGTPGKPKAFLVDIDGTLAHMRDYRGPFDWAKVGLDDVDEQISWMVNAMWKGSEFMEGTEDDLIKVIVMSGRDAACRGLTEEWLDKHDIWFDHLFMRPEDDMRPDNIVKAELFDQHVRDNFDVKFVIDDRWQVCQMWLQMGLKVFNVSGLDRGEF